MDSNGNGGGGRHFSRGEAQALIGRSVRALRLRGASRHDVPKDTPGRVVGAEQFAGRDEWDVIVRWQITVTRDHHREPLEDRVPKQDFRSACALVRSRGGL